MLVMQYFMLLQIWEVINDCLWSIALISHGSLESINSIYDFSIVEELLFYIDDYPLPILSVYGNICAGSELQIKRLLDNDILNILDSYFNSSNNDILEEVYFVLSNIVTGGMPTISRLISHNIFDKSLILIKNYPESIKIKASYYIRNLVKLTSSEVISKILDLGSIAALSTINEFTSNELKKQLLDIYKYILDVIGAEEFLSHRYSYIYQDTLNAISLSNDNKLSTKASDIIWHHFEAMQD